MHDDIPYDLIEDIISDDDATLWRATGADGWRGYVWVMSAGAEASAEGIALVKTLNDLDGPARLPRVTEVGPRVMALDAPSPLRSFMSQSNPIKPVRALHNTCKAYQYLGDALQNTLTAEELKLATEFDASDLWTDDQGEVVLMGLLRRLWHMRPIGRWSSRPRPHVTGSMVNLGICLLASMCPNPAGVITVLFGDRLTEDLESSIAPEVLALGYRLIGLHDREEDDDTPPEDEHRGFEELSWMFTALLTAEREKYPELEALRLNEAMEWLRDKAMKDDLGAIRALLRRRPELARAPVLTDYVWSHFGELLLEPLTHPLSLPVTFADIIVKLPAAAPALASIVLDERQLDSNRVTAARLIGAIGAGLVKPALFDVLNTTDRLAVASAARDALELMDKEQPVRLDPRSAQIVPCSLTWDSLTPMASSAEVKCETRFCGQCATPVVRVTDMESLNDVTRQGGCVFLDRLADPTLLRLWGDGGRSWTLKGGDKLRLGSKAGMEIVETTLKGEHAEIEHVGQGTLALRAVGGEVTQQGVSVLEVIGSHDEPFEATVGPLTIGWSHDGVPSIRSRRWQEPIPTMGIGIFHPPGPEAPQDEGAAPEPSGDPTRCARDRALLSTHDGTWWDSLVGLFSVHDAGGLIWDGRGLVQTPQGVQALWSSISHVQVTTFSSPHSGGAGLHIEVQGDDSQRVAFCVHVPAARLGQIARGSAPSRPLWMKFNDFERFWSVLVTHCAQAGLKQVLRPG